MNTTLEMKQEYQTSQELKRNPRKRGKLLNASLIIMSIILWFGLLYGGYLLANQYINASKAHIDAKVIEIEKLNQEQIEAVSKFQTELNEVSSELISIKEELALIQEDLSLTGETLTGTDKTKLALQQRIDELNKQLNDLKDAIQRLEDAAK